MVEQNFRVSSNDLPWREYFSEYAEWRSKTFGYDEAEEEAVAIEVLETGPVDPAIIKAASPKKYITLALEHGLTVECCRSELIKHGEIIKSGERVGERRPDKTVSNLWTTAYIRGGMAFQTRHTDNRFTDALVWDQAGWPTILEADYSYNKNEQKSRRMSESDAQEVELRLVNQYNDGELWTNRSPRVVTSVGAFEEWLHDLFPTFTPKTPAIRKPKPTEPDTLVEQILAGTEWSAEV